MEAVYHSYKELTVTQTQASAIYTNIRNKASIFYGYHISLTVS